MTVKSAGSGPWEPLTKHVVYYAPGAASGDEERLRNKLARLEKTVEALAHDVFEEAKSATTSSALPATTAGCTRYEQALQAGHTVERALAIGGLADFRPDSVRKRTGNVARARTPRSTGRAWRKEK